jgi:HD-like signal output (HDOD) protein
VRAAPSSHLTAVPSAPRGSGNASASVSPPTVKLVGGSGAKAAPAGLANATTTRTPMPNGKKRILFVDDDPRMLESLRLGFRKQTSDWETVFVLGAEAALTELRAHEYHAVVADLRMPGTDGPKLCARIKEEFPKVLRYLHATLNERDLALRSLAVCHQVLVKPCDPQLLRAAIDRTAGLDRILDNERVRAIVGHVEHLPVLPRVYTELTQAFARPDCTPRMIARIIEGDPAISAELLRLVNSSFFALAQRMSSPERAIVYLGLDLVRSLALTTKVFSTKLKPIKGFSLNEVHADSFLTALLARRMPRTQQARDYAATAGLLHDVGQLILASEHPDRFAKVIKRVKSDPNIPLEFAEREEFGASHAEIGAYLVGLWNLPSEVVEAIAYHHEPHGAPEVNEVLRAVHVSSMLVERELQRIRGERVSPIPKLPSKVAYLSDEIDGWRRTAAREVAKWHEDRDEAEAA